MLLFCVAVYLPTLSVVVGKRFGNYKYPALFRFWHSSRTILPGRFESPFASFIQDMSSLRNTWSKVFYLTSEAANSNLRTRWHQTASACTASPSLHYPAHRTAHGHSFRRATHGSSLSYFERIILILEVIGKLKAKEDAMTTRTKAMHKSMVKVWRFEDIPISTDCICRFWRYNPRCLFSFSRQLSHSYSWKSKFMTRHFLSIQYFWYEQ